MIQRMCNLLIPGRSYAVLRDAPRNATYNACMCELKKIIRLFDPEYKDDGCSRYVPHNRSFTRERKSRNDTVQFLDSCVETF